MSDTVPTAVVQTVIVPPAAPSQPVPPPPVLPVIPQAASGLVGTLLPYVAAMPALKTCILAIVLTVCGVVWQNQSVLVSGLAEAVVQRAGARTERVHATALSDAVVRTRQIGSVLNSVREDLQSSRALLMEFHNGSESLRGVPFLYQSATAESVSQGVSTVREGSQRVPLGTTIEWIPTLLKGQCVDQPIVAAGPTLAAAMETNGTVRVYACPVFVNGSREPAAYVVASYVKGWDVPEREPSFVKLRGAAQLIGATLSAYLDAVGPR